MRTSRNRSSKILIPTALALLATSALALAEERPCTNTPSGLPYAQGDKVVCRVERALTKENAPELDKQTMGLVKRIDVVADLSFSVQPARGIGGLESTLALDPQVVRGTITWGGNNTSKLEITLAPRATISGTSVCNLELRSVELGVTKVKTGAVLLDGLLTAYVKSQTAKVEAEAKLSLAKSLLPLQNTSCDLRPATPHDDPYRPDARLLYLSDKYARYLSWSEQGLDEHGWTRDTKCDGLLMNSIYSLSGGPADIPQATWGDGRWERHWLKNCYPNGSKSTISRDMMAGLLLWLQARQRVDLIEQIIAYGEQHSFQGFPLIWIVGQGELGRVDQPPSFVSKIYRLREKLTGKPNPYPQMKTQVLDKCRSYTCHLTVLEMLFEYRLDGTMTVSAQQYLRALADSHPRNALFNVLYGKLAQSSAHVGRALDTLLDPTLFPEDRLPSNHDRCNDYIFSREEREEDGSVNRNWLPCPNEPRTVFSGTDFLFAAAIALDLLG